MTAYIMPLILSAAISGILGVCSWRQRTMASRIFAILMLELAAWAMGYALELLASTLAAKILWENILRMLYATVPVMMLLFVIQYTGREGLLPHRRWTLFFIIPAITILLSWTNEWHHAIERDLKILVSGPLQVLVSTNGPWYWVHAFYSYALLLSCAILLVISLLGASSISRRQLLTLLLALVVPFGLNLLFVAGGHLFVKGYDPTPVVFSIAGVVTAWGLFRYRRLNLIPMARDLIVESLGNGVVVLDITNQIVDFNCMAQEIIGVPAEQTLGIPFDQVFKSWPDLIALTHSSTAQHVEWISQLKEPPRYFDVHLTPVGDSRGRLIGRIFTFHDVTERNQFTQEILHRTQELGVLNRVTSAVSSVLDLKVVLDTVVCEIANVFDAQSSGIALLNPERTLMTIVADYVVDAAVPSAVGTLFPVSGDTSSRSVIDDKPVVILQPQTNTMTKAIHDIFRARRSECTMIVPLRTRRGIVGTIGVDTDQPGRIFTDSEVALAETVAGQVANAIENANLFEESQRRDRQLTTAAEVSQTAIAMLDTLELIAKITELIRERFNLYFVGLYLADESGHWAVLRYATGEVGASMVAQNHRLEIGEHSMVGWAMSYRQPRIALQAELDPVRFANPLLPDTRSELAQQSFDVRECIESASDLIAPKAAEKELELVGTVEGSVPACIFSDPIRLRQILINLVSNAVKFTNRGEVEISVTGEKISSVRPATGTLGTYILYFSVRDTGIGSPRQRMDRLFQSFSQIDASMTRKYGGTGLGPVICKLLVELLGGKIWAESEIGSGSTFHFTMRAPAIDNQRPTYLDGQPPVLAGKRVLAVDDQPTSLRWLARQLQAWGLEAGTTASASEALDQMRQAGEDARSFDLAILDMHMPEVDDPALAELICAEAGIASLPLALLTPVGIPAGDARLKRFAVSLYKPVKPVLLYAMLLQILAGEAHVTLAQVEGRAAPSSGYQFSGRESEFDAHMAQRLPLSILLVEDNPINQKLALLILERLGYAADLAVTRKQAIEILRHQAYDVVLMDVQMPEMDDLEATRRIRAVFASDQRPYVIAMTANAMKEDRDICLQAGMNDYLSKPIQIGDLVTALTRAGESLAPHGQEMYGRGILAPIEPASYGRGTPTPNDPALDTGILKRLRDTLGNQADALLPDLIANFCTGAPQLIQAAQQALAQEQIDELRRAAHTLKSTSATFGAVALSELARQLEYRARDRKLAGSEALLEQIQAGFERAWTALEVLLMIQISNNECTLHDGVLAFSPDGQFLQKIEVH